MKSYTILKAILLIVFVLPILYDYFDILPASTKYILDAFLILYILNNKNVFNYSSAFKRLYFTYIAIIILITVFSLLIHNEGILYFIQEFRRLVYPFIFYSMFRYSLRFEHSSSVNLHQLFMRIFYLQIPITIVQIVFYDNFKAMGIFSKKELYLVDAATGTLGQGGHSILGILIPLVFIYLYDLKNIKSGFLLLIPFILANSGGGVIILIIVLFMLSIYSLFYGALSYRIAFLSSIALVVFISVTLLSSYIEMYTRDFMFYEKNYISKGKTTFVDRPYKVSRLNGYKYLNSKMNEYNLEPFFGLGFEFQERGVNNFPYQFKNDINTIIAERGYLGLFSFVVFFIILIILVNKNALWNSYKFRFIKILFFSTFLMGCFYNQPTRSFQIWFFTLFYLALLENKQHYNTLLNHLKGKTKIK